MFQFAKNVFDRRVCKTNFSEEFYSSLESTNQIIEHDLFRFSERSISAKSKILQGIYLQDRVLVSGCKRAISFKPHDHRLQQ